MKQAALVALAAFLAASGMAAVLPKDNISGALYRYNADNDETEMVAVPRPDEDADNPSGSGSGDLHTRATTVPHVTKTVCGDAFPHWIDVESAIESFDKMLEGEGRDLKARNKLFSPSGDANIFVCNYGKDIKVTKDILHMLIDNAQRNCGGEPGLDKYTSSWVTMQRTNMKLSGGITTGDNPGCDFKSPAV